MDAQELRDWLDANGYTQVALAKALGVGPATVSQWCAGRYRIPRMAEIALGTLPPKPSEAPKPPRARRESKSSLILDYLQSHYPSEALPFGALTEVGTRFGVTRERVRQIAVANGFVGYKAQTVSQRMNPGHMGRTLCPDCGKPYGVRRYPVDRIAKWRCPECRWVEIACAGCGTLKRLRTGAYLLKASGQRGNRGFAHVASTPTVFCSRQCMGRYRGQTVGFAAHPENTGILVGAANNAAVLAALDVPRTAREIAHLTGRVYNTVTEVLSRLHREGKVRYTVLPGTGSPRLWERVS